MLRPGQEVVLINVSCGGALIASSNRLKPGTTTELQLRGNRRHIVRCRVERCWVAALDPLRYEGAIVFEQQLDCRAEGE